MILKRIWNKHTIFTGGCVSEYWVDSDYVLPIISKMFKVNVIWYKIANGADAKTNAIISKENITVNI